MGFLDALSEWRRAFLLYRSTQEAAFEQHGHELPNEKGQLLLALSEDASEKLRWMLAMAEVAAEGLQPGLAFAMDPAAQFDDGSNCVVFAFAAGGKLHPGSVTLEALAGLARSELAPGADAVAAYQTYWHTVHSAALALRAEGRLFPVVQLLDVQ